jgi:transposase
MTVRDVAEWVGCAPGSVSRWTAVRRTGGDAALNPILNAVSTPRLGELQQRQLCALLALGARAHGFATGLWTLSRVRTVIATEFGIEYSFSNLHVLLGKLGFSNQAATKRSREQDPGAVREVARAQESPERGAHAPRQLGGLALVEGASRDMEHRDPDRRRER